MQININIYGYFIIDAYRISIFCQRYRPNDRKEILRVTKKLN
jgi:hypothetical protein